MAPSPLEDLEIFQIAFEYTNLSMELVGLEGSIFEATKACPHLFGFITDELKGLNMLDL